MITTIGDCVRPGMVLERFPLQPLVMAAGAESLCHLARAVGVSSRTIHRWAHNGIPIYAADRAAIAIGTHPLLVWPDHWQYVLKATDAVAVDSPGAVI